MDAPVYISSMGIVTALGIGIEKNLEMLLASRSGIGKLNYLNTIHKDIFPAGELKKSNEEILDLIRGNFTLPASRTCLLGILAMKECLEKAGLNMKKEKIAFINSTTVAGMDRTEIYYTDLKEGRNTDYAKSHQCGVNSKIIADFFGLNEYVSTISTACSSGANAIMMGARLIRSGRFDKVIAGGMDALSKFTVNGFNSLMILDKEWCQPFDHNRRGLNLGEGSAFLLLESEASLKERGVSPLGIVSGYHNANDAYHQTASSPEGTGATLAMQGALKVAGLTPEDIDYINMHGTGTANNDLSEGIAANKVFEKVPVFSSTKAFTGHTLAPAGAIEAVFSLLSIQHSCIFPNLNWKTAMEEFDLKPVTELMSDVRLNHVMSNSFGFGGNNTTLIFSKT